MKKLIYCFYCFIILFVSLWIPLNDIKAYTMWTAYTTNSPSQTVRSTPAFNNNIIEEIPSYVSFRVVDEDGEFLKIVYGNNKSGWVWNGKKDIIKKSSNPTTSYNRPWTTPGKSIIGGSQIIAETYVKAGQYTSYLKKFQVNPNASVGLYTHQYQTNIRAPYIESRTAYKGYNPYLRDITFTFAIPIYNNMPDNTDISLRTNMGTKTTADELNDSTFEAKLTSEGFPESYKLYLRSLHKNYPNWEFKGLSTGLNFDEAVTKEVPYSCIETYTGFGTYEGCGNESSAWSMATKEAVAHFMDPRNFLDQESIFMFEDLSNYENVTETMVQRILSGTFMKGISSKDGKNYSALFIEAGKTNKINPIYLASLVTSEVGTSGNVIQVTGDSLDYYGLRYTSVYNFYNIGANSLFTARGGIVWASGGDPSTYTFLNNYAFIETPGQLAPVPVIDFDRYITNAGYKVSGNYILNIKEKTTVDMIKSKFSGINVSLSNSSNYVGTGSILTLSKDGKSYQKTITVTGDTDGDGIITAGDYVGIKNYIMGSIKFSKEQSMGADMNNNDTVDAGDYVGIKNYIMNN